MSDTRNDAKDGWIADVLGLDPNADAGGVAGRGPSSELSAFRRVKTDLKNVVTDIGVQVGITTEAAGQATRGLAGRIAETGADAVEAAKGAAGWGTPATAAPTGPVALTSQAEEANPGPRTRTRLGVGERVVLTVTGGAGKWSVSGGKISAKAGTTVTLTAPQRPGTAEVTVDVGGTKASLSFTVIAPNSVSMVMVANNHEDNSFPNAGMTLQPYFGPDDVNFANVTFTEDDVGAKATGYWDEFNGVGHSPNPAPLGCSNTVVNGRGTLVNAHDGVQSGWIPKNPPLTDWSGTLTFNIPWHWQCGSGAGLIARVLHRVVTNAAGSTTISKGGATFTAALSP